MDVRILKALANRQRFRTLEAFVPKDMATPEALAMMRWFACYYSTFPEHEEVDVDQLLWLIKERSTGQSPEAVAVTLAYANQLRQPIDETSVKGAIATLYDLDFVGQAGAILSAYDNGDDIDPVHMLEDLARRAKRAKANGKADDYERTSIGDILREVENDAGLKFTHIPVLYETLRGLTPGASIAVAARPDKGKTSFIAAALAAFAPQCVRDYGENRPILWLNNEGTAKRIKPRLYQAALHMTLEEIITLEREDRLEGAYMQALGIPDLEYIRVKDIHGSNLAQVEQVIEDMQPSVVVYDMLANVRMNMQAGGNKADAVEAAWQSVREIAVRYQHVAISTIQMSAEGDNQLYPGYSALKDSKTAVQGAADVILMLGSLNDPSLQAMRGIATPKNKFAMTGKPSHVQAEIYFDGARCVFDSGEKSVECNVNERPPVAQVQGQCTVPGAGAAQGGRGTLPRLPPQV